MQVRLLCYHVRNLFSLLYGHIVYAIEATVHAPSWEGVYSEIMKVLKPGGVVSSSLGQQNRTARLTWVSVWCLRVVYDA
jgi:hypothetical protein